MAVRYLRILTLYSSLLALAIVILNLLVDPFGIYRFQGIPSLQLRASSLNLYLRKDYAIFLNKPDGLLLGTSKVAQGLDPKHPGLTKYADNVFNAGMANYTINETYHLLLHAQRINPLTVVVIGLDPGSFREKPSPNWKPPETWVYSKSSSPFKYLFKNILIDTLFSMNALVGSLETVANQGNSYYVPPFKNGMLSDSMRRSGVKKKGHRLMFHFTENNLAKIPQVNLDRLKTSDPNILYASPLESLRKIIRFCKNNDIRLFLFTSPQHARIIELSDLLGGSSVNEKFKEILTQVVDQENSRDPVNPIQLWDFMAYNRITTEPVPPLGDTETHMKYYWDGSHYKRVVGNMIFDRMFEYSDPERHIPEDFGVKINTENIESCLKDFRQQRSRYMETHADELNEMRKRLGL